MYHMRNFLLLYKSKTVQQQKNTLLIFYFCLDRKVKKRVYDMLTSTKTSRLLNITIVFTYSVESVEYNMSYRMIKYHMDKTPE